MTADDLVGGLSIQVCFVPRDKILKLLSNSSKLIFGLGRVGIFCQLCLRSDSIIERVHFRHENFNKPAGNHCSLHDRRPLVSCYLS